MRRLRSNHQYPVTIILPVNWLDRVRYQLDEPVEIAGTTVPVGFVSDAATIPRIFWPVFPPVGRYFAASLAHDYALSRGYRWPEATDVFEEALIEAGVCGWRLKCLVGAVRFYGVIRGLHHHR